MDTLHNESVTLSDKDATHLLCDASDFQCHNNGELFGEVVTIHWQLSGGKGHGVMGAWEMDAPHPSSLPDVHPCHESGGVAVKDKREEIQRNQVWKQ